MISVLMAGMLAAASMAPQAHGLGISAHLEMQANHQVLIFKVVNSSNTQMTFDRASSPCAPYDLVTIVFVGGGGIGLFIERLPLIADTISGDIVVKPHGEHSCTFDVTQWFNGKIPRGKQATLLWSFKPDKSGTFNRPLYGGAVLLQEEGPEKGMVGSREEAK